MKQMNINELPEMLQKSAGGLFAPSEWKKSIRIEAANRSLASRKKLCDAWFSRALLPASLAVVLLLTLLIPARPVDLSEPQLVRSISAGSSNSTETGDKHQALLTLVTGDVGIGTSSDAPKYRSLWASGENGVFPLIGIRGKYYRMMSSPKSIDDSLLDQPLETVSEFTPDPALSDGSGIVSNIVPLDSPIFPVSGMEGTLVAAEVDGKMRVFQRVSFNGQALTAGESLADTLQVGGQVVSLSLSDVGVVTDPNVISSLLEVLFTNASYQSGSGMRANQALYMELSNGITLQMTVKDGKLGACGTWACQEFLDAFSASIQ